MADLRMGTLHKGDNSSALANTASESTTHMEVCRVFRASEFHLFWFLACKAFLKFSNKKLTAELLFGPHKLMISAKWYYFTIH